MIKAVDNKGIEVFIWSANTGEQYFCPICHKPLVQRRGEIRAHHFAHAGSKEESYTGCTDRWQYDKSNWHIEWQRRFPEENCEKIICNQEQKHIADVNINNLVIEFQHSAISIDEFRNRNRFYSAAGYNVIWVFDLAEEWSDNKIEDTDYQNNKYTWAYPRKLFREMDIRNEEATVYFQLSNDEDKDSYVIERVTGGYNNFSQFYTDLNHALSIPKFIEKAFENDSSLVYKPKKHIEAPAKIINGHSIYDLWKSDYKYMIVTNLFTQKTMIIFGNYGEMNHQENGKIIGKYTWKSGDTYEYSDEKYVVWDAEKEVWVMKFAKTNK